MTVDVIALGDDLIFFSRIAAEAHAAGLTARQHRDPGTVTETARVNSSRVVLLDLTYPGLDVSKIVSDAAGLRVVAYGPHVEAEMLRAARRAGCDLVLPRSKFVEELPAILKGGMINRGEAESAEKTED